MAPPPSTLIQVMESPADVRSMASDIYYYSGTKGSDTPAPILPAYNTCARPAGRWLGCLLFAGLAGSPGAAAVQLRCSCGAGRAAAGRRPPAAGASC
jgi:hypothetical protein